LRGQSNRDLSSGLQVSTRMAQKSLPVGLLPHI
jgi:hypothetical protein